MNIIDLFCGCGGMRYAVSDYFTECIFSCDIDKFASQTYQANFNHIPFGDIRSIRNNSVKQINGEVCRFETSKLRNADLMLGGFPCQPFSLAGKKLGVNDKDRGDLIDEIIRLVNGFHPKAVLLENVPHLAKIHNGKFFDMILDTFSYIGYRNSYIINYNAKDFGLPQNRNRLYIILFKNKKIDFKFPQPPRIPTKIGDILEKNVDKKYYLSDKMKTFLHRHQEEQKVKGNNFGYNLFAGEDTHTNTLLARYGKDGKETLIYQYRRGVIRQSKPGICPTLTANMGMGGHNVPIITSNEIEVRKLTPRECARLQGFPDSFKFPVSDSQAYKQIGNSVAVPVVRAIAKEIYRSLGGQI
ncbi:MAG: DNA (cytosine-5-)-methyltransferase [Alphaproteobacteria bacterium]|jgi:DNA (cytosine-5)-methyltransferase 1|nr:DNA (cytosine-5-)-methyltransferase [Alphaproteobacteria bacterium]